jgi:hypothetical protein
MANGEAAEWRVRAEDHDPDDQNPARDIEADDDPEAGEEAEDEEAGDDHAE